MLALTCKKEFFALMQAQVLQQKKHIIFQNMPLCSFSFLKVYYDYTSVPLT